MADSNIGSLPAAESLNDDSLLVAEQSGTAVHVKGKILKDFAKQGVDVYVTEAVTAANEAKAAAKDAQNAVTQIGTAVEDTQANAAAAETAKADAESAKTAAEQAAESANAAIGSITAAKEAAEAAALAASTNAETAEAAKSAAQTAQSAAETAKTSAEDASTTASQKAAESAQNAENTAADKAAAATSATNAEAARQAIENMIVEAVTLATGSPASVTKETVDGVVKLIFGLPSGAKGDPGATITSITRTSGTGAPGTTDTYTVNMSDGSVAGTFTVYNGANGEGAGDMTAAVYDPQGKATDVFQYVDDAVAAIPTPDVSAQIKAHNESESAHPDIREALENISVTTDETPTEGSTNPVQSGGVYDALTGKQDALSGNAGQFVGFDEDGKPAAQDAPSGLPVDVQILEVICKDLELTAEANTYTFPEAITLDEDGLYWLKLELYEQGNMSEASAVFAKVITDSTGSYVRWLSADDYNSVTLTSTQIADTWLVEKDVLSIYKVSVDVTDDLLFQSMNREGWHTTASGAASHAEGWETTASGYYAHAEGYYTTASGDTSHAEGWETTASGAASHAEGYYTTASSFEAHAEGYYTTASGFASHAEGWETTASGAYSHVQGRYNLDDNTGELAHIVGNGNNENNRSNAHTLDWSGNAWFAGDVYVGSTSGTNKDEGSKKLATVDELNAAIPTGTAGQFVVIGADGKLVAVSLTNVSEVGA